MKRKRWRGVGEMKEKQGKGGEIEQGKRRVEFRMKRREKE